LSRALARKADPGTDASNNSAAQSALIAQEVLLSGAVQFLEKTGIPRPRVARKLRTLADALEAGRRISTKHSNEYDLFVSVSGVVHDWTRSAEYTGRDGQPRALPLRGRRGISALIRSRIPRLPISSILRWMSVRGIARRRWDGRYLLLKRAVLVGNPDPVYLELAATVATLHLRTAIENWEEKNPKARQLDRIARVFFLPEKEVPNFREFAKGRAESWLEEIDNWLEDHNAPPSRRGRVQAGVHVYGYAAGLE